MRGKSRADVYVLMESHLVRVCVGNVHPVRPVDNIDGLLSILDKVFVRSLVRGLDFVAAERDSLDGPVGVLDIEYFSGDGGDNAKVVAGAVHGPEEIGFRCDGRQRPVSQNDVQRNKLVSYEAVVPLKPAVSASKRGTEVADTFASSSDCQSQLSA